MLGQQHTHRNIIPSVIVNKSDQQLRTIKFISVERSHFFPTLKKRVDDFFVQQGLSKYGGKRLFIKTAVLFAAYLLPYMLLLLWTPMFSVSLLLWFIMGLGMAGLGMSVMHDANHGAYSSNKSMNWIMAHVLNIMGGSTQNWKMQHNILHHTFTNITNMDDDIGSKPGLRLSPHTSVSGIHRYQWMYAFLLYGISTLYWVTAKDFLQFFRYRRRQVSGAKNTSPLLALLKLAILKIVYFGFFLVLPTALTSIPFIEVLAGFLLMHFVAGLVLTIVFQLAHSVEGTDHPLPDRDGRVDNQWAIHQMNTTMNFAADNKWLSWYVGGLNFQIEHHLFPKISHVHYPSIANIVETTAAEFDIPYLNHPTFADAFKAHVFFLKKLGKLPELDTAIG